MFEIKQSTAETIVFFVHDSAGDAVLSLVDGGFTKRISKGSAAFGAMTVTITEMENGFYSIPLSTSHSDTTGILTVLFTHGSSKQINLQWRVEANLADDLATDIGTAQSDLDIITGASGVNLLTATQASIDAIETDTGTTIPGTITTAQNDLDIITGASGVNLLTATQASIDAIEADTNELQGDDVPGLIATVTTDLDDIKGTGFVKDTHSLFDIEGYVDILDDGTSGNAKIATDAAAILVDTGTTLNDKIDTIDTVVDTILIDTGNTLPAQISAQNDASVTEILTTQMTEAYAANGVAPTMAQSLFGIHQMLMEFSISGTSYTVKKLDSSTTAFVVTLDDATNPTGNTR